MERSFGSARAGRSGVSWTADLASGELRLNGILAGSFYSGHPPHVNDVDATNIRDLGPIPLGWWTISGPPFDDPEHGPYCLRLTPDKDTIVFGRSGFLIHGDSKEHPRQASKGCVIAPRNVRERIYQSGDVRLEVCCGITPLHPDVTGEISV